MTTFKSELISQLEKLLHHPEMVWHTMLVYIFFNPRHEERRKRMEKQNNKGMRVQFAKCNH